MTVRLGSQRNKELLFRSINNKRQKTGMCLSWLSGELGKEKYFSHSGEEVVIVVK
jgi:hypothetical protein